MLLARERELVSRYARRLAADGLAVGTAGNLSVRAGDLVAVTPSALDYDELEPALVPVVDLDGARADGELPPSTEVPLHLALYHAGAGAVVHTHSPAATALGTVTDELPAIHYLVADLGGPVRVAPYRQPATPELAEEAARAVEGRTAVLLGNHGAITLGDTLEKAYARAQLLEWLADVYLRARLVGEPRLLSDDELAEMGLALERYRA